MSASENALDQILEEFESMDELQRAGEPLSNIRHEIFAQHVSVGTKPQNAYRIAYNIGEDGSVGSRHHDLLKRPEVRQRVGQLLHARSQTLINRSLLTERNVMDELAWGIKEARESGKLKDHHQYVKSTAQILGMFIESQSKSDLADKSLAELKEEARLLESELGIPAAAIEPPSTPPSLPPSEDGESL